MQLAPGDIIDGRFEVESMVGEGGLAEVYRVRHRELGRLMALKLLTWRKKSLQERLVLEGRIQAQLVHPNIVAVLDLVRHDGQVGLLMEYVDAENLHDHIQRVGATPQDEALELMGPILAAVDIAHRSGITHRDLKPGNVMLAKVGTGIVPKVADFGIAKVVQEEAATGPQTRAGSAMGTPGYLAPEQVRDASTIDARADVFALASIAYEVLCGEAAFADEHGHIEVTATATMEPVPIEDRVQVTPCVAEALREALCKDVEERTPTVQAFAEKLLRSRPDLVERLRASAARPLDLSLPPTEELPTGMAKAIAYQRANETLAPPPLPPPTTGSRATLVLAGGGVAAGIVGTLVVLGIGVGVAMYLASRPPTLVEKPAPAPPAVAVAPSPVPAPVPVPVEVAAEPAPVVTAPEPSPAPSSAPPTAPAPRKPVAARAAPKGPPEVAEAPVPAPADPVVVKVPAATAPPPPQPAAALPPPEPEAPAPTPAPDVPSVAGSWSGKAGGQRMALNLGGSDGAVQGTFTLYVGTQTRQETVSGTIQPDGSLRFSAGDLVFMGKLADGQLSGVYMRDGAKKSLKWSARSK